MNKIVFLTLLMLTGNALPAQDLSKVKIDKSPMDAAYYPADAPKRFFAKSEKKKKSLEPKIRVIYSRPSLNGRTVFGELIRYGEKWRAGANESTEIRFYQDVVIGGKEIASGNYSITIVPTENEWSVHFNSSTDEWGSYRHNPDLDVAVIKIPVTNNSQKLEHLTMLFYSPESNNVVHLKIGWDTTVAEIPIVIE